MPAGFAGLQVLESRLIGTGLAGVRVPWMLEIAPTASASPELPSRRCRILIDGLQCRWPFYAPIDQLPLEDRSVPAALLRHVWQPAVEFDPLDEVMRVLKPGGVLVSVTANPWHRMAWRELGRSALRLPSWPHFQVLHIRRGLSLSMPNLEQLRGLVPGLSPVLIIVAHKPADPARIRPVNFSRPEMAPGQAALTQCRAA